MLLITTITRALQRLTSSRPFPTPVYHAPAALRAALERERARSDRSGTIFSFLSFTDGSRPALERAIDVLRTRLRTTDEFGWMDDDQVGVVLLDAPAVQAWMIVDDVLRDWPTELPRPVCEVFSYPERRAPRGRSTSPAHASRRRGPRRVQPAARSARPQPINRPVQRMASLFVHRMPAWKRGIDMLGATVGLLLSAPVIAIAAGAIKLSSPGTVIYRQKRAGLGGRPFTIYKLRTMAAGADAAKHQLMAQNEQDGPAFKIKDDPRVTVVGRILRKTSVDELPQFLNVLLGDMSLVGPRPLPWDEAQACEGWQQRRLDVTPGLTGIWQVKGRARTGFTDWVRMDMRYIRARSLVQDMKLLVLTIPAVILRKGAH